MIFSKKNKTVAGAMTFIGAYLPQQLVDAISFLALVNQTSKTEIITQFIESGIARIFKSQSCQEMYSTIANHALWKFKCDQKQEKGKREYKNWTHFLAQCRQELTQRKNLKSSDIKEIMDILLKTDCE